MDLNEILSSLSADDINNLKKTASSLFGGAADSDTKSENASPVSGGLDASALLASLSGSGKSSSGGDNRAALLSALKPMLSDERKVKVDEAMKLLKLMQLLPMLKNSGLLNDLF